MSKIPEIMSFYVIPICTNVGDYTSVYLGSDNSIIMEGEGVKPCLRGIRTAINMPLRKRLEMRENARKLAAAERLDTGK